MPIPTCQLSHDKDPDERKSTSAEGILSSDSRQLAKKTKWGQRHQLFPKLFRIKILRRKNGIFNNFQRTISPFEQNFISSRHSTTKPKRKRQRQIFEPKRQGIQCNTSRQRLIATQVPIATKILQQQILQQQRTNIFQKFFKIRKLDRNASSLASISIPQQFLIK